MPMIYKTRFEDNEGNIHLFHSSADVVAFDSTDVKNLNQSNVQDAIVQLNEKAEGKVSKIALNAVVKASDFTGDRAPYTQMIHVEGILETDNPDITAELDDNDVNLALAQRDAFGSITRILTADNTIVVQCYEDKPKVDIPLIIRVLR